jgi:hypothetical protein
VVPQKFDPELAAYFSILGDPVLTASLRRGLRAVGDYFQLLTVLAEGRNIEEAKAQITAIAGSVAGLATLATAGAAAPLAGIVGELGPLIEQWAMARNAEELRRLVVQGEPKVDALLVTMQKASGEMYETLQRESVRTFRTADEASARRNAILRIAGDNAAVADYVVLLGGLRDALSALAAAVRSPDSPLALAALSRSADTLLIDAQAASRAIALIRR